MAYQLLWPQELVDRVAERVELDRQAHDWEAFFIKSLGTSL